MHETINENSHDQNKEVEVEPRCSKRARTEKYFSPNFLTYICLKVNLGLLKRSELYRKSSVKKAIKNEINSILQNHTWELVDLPPSCKPLSSK